MVGKFQAYMIVIFCKKHLMFPVLAALFALVGAGCGTVGSVTTLVNQDYATYVKNVDEHLKSSPLILKSGYFLQESVKRRILHESLMSIQKNGTESIETSSLRREHLEYTRALIEIGDFKKASMVCDQGIQIGLKIENALEEKGKRDVINALSRAIVEGVMNTSIEPETDNGAYLRRMFLYKTYITWFETGNKNKAFGEFEQFLKTNGANEDLIFLLMDRGSFYDAIMGDYRKSLDEFIRAAAEIEKMHILNTDMRYVYSMEVSTRMSDIYLKLGELNNAENALLKGEEQRKGLLYKLGGLIAGLQQSKMAIVKSKQGALYSLLRDFKKSKELFDAALRKVSSIDPDSTDILYQRVLGTYYVNYGAFYLGLQGKYKEAIENVDKGLRRLKPYYLEATENEPNIVTAHLYSGELHYLIGNEEMALGNSKEAKEHYETALSRAKSTIQYANELKNQIAQANAYTLMGQTHYKKRELKQARESYEKALAFFEKPQGSGKKLENTENWKLYYGLGEVYEAGDNLTKALSFYEKAVDEVEKLWSGRFKDSQRQVSFIDNRLIVFEPMIRILAKQGKAAEAIKYMEMSKSRTFFETSVFAKHRNESVAVAQIDPVDVKKLENVRKEITELSEKIEQRSSKIQDLNISLGEDTEIASSRGVAGVKEVKKNKKTSGSVKTLSVAEKQKLTKEKAGHEKELNDMTMRHDALAKEEQAFLEKAGGTTRDISNIKILNATEIKRLLPDDKMALLEYYIGENSVIGAVISKKGVVVSDLNIKPDRLKKQILSLKKYLDEYPNIDDDNINYDYKENGLSLYDQLVRPFEKSLSGIEKVGIIPHGVLHYLPFQALVVSNESEKGIDPQLLKEEKTLLAMRRCNTDISNRGVGGVRENKASGEAFENCEKMIATRGVKGTREIKKTEQENGVSTQDVAVELEFTRSKIAALRIEKGIRSSRPVFFIDKFKVFYAPSASILKVVHLQNANRKDKLLAIGSPPPLDIKDLKDAGISAIDVFAKLINAKTEVEEVSALFSEKTKFTDEAATLTMAKNYAPQNDLILFSTHGLLNRVEPLKSAVFFNKDSGNNGRLTVSEIEKLRLNANLVVLSACQTGLMVGYEGVSEDITDIKFPHGDDLVGLQRAFMKAGAASVMSTLWEVDDESTSVFIIDFFKRFKNGEDKVTALQGATLNLIMQKDNDKEWDHPSYWAPFVLSGDWR